MMEGMTIAGAKRSLQSLKKDKPNKGKEQKLVEELEKLLIQLKKMLHGS